MARVTIEDCVEVVQNRFELVILAAEMARGIASGSVSTISLDEDKNHNNHKITVSALRYIAKGKVDTEALQERIISSLQKNNQMDGVEESNLHAEAQESFGEKNDYSPKSEENIFHHDLGDFSDENILDFSDESYDTADLDESREKK
jgi:DNA-directed RNA polymerase subunit omega